MLKAKVVMPDGVVVSTDEGVPQGGPLSPLLSNIVLRRARPRARPARAPLRALCGRLQHLRPQRTRRAARDGERRRFIERRLRLKVNAAKSAVARPEERHFVGFRLRREPRDGEVEGAAVEALEERASTERIRDSPNSRGLSRRRARR